jgi:hypothetical protein
VPLSEHEQRQFEAIERALLADDPKFASAVRRRDPVVAGRRRLVLAAVVLVVGLGVLLTGVVTGLWYVGVAGFVVMLAAAVLGAYAVRAMTGRTGRAQTGPGSVTHLTERRRRNRAAGGSGGGLIGRLEERWQRRIDRQGL